MKEKSTYDLLLEVVQRQKEVIKHQEQTIEKMIKALKGLSKNAGVAKR
tara:strand:- start:74 stop:217 length:144 start_codon:yes stop_codon:yes gene_type:complete